MGIPAFGQQRAVGGKVLGLRSGVGHAGIDPAQGRRPGDIGVERAGHVHHRDVFKIGIVAGAERIAQRRALDHNCNGAAERCIGRKIDIAAQRRNRRRSALRPAGSVARRSGHDRPAQRTVTAGRSIAAVHRGALPSRCERQLGRIIGDRDPRRIKQGADLARISLVGEGHYVFQRGPAKAHIGPARDQLLGHLELARRLFLHQCCGGLGLEGDHIGRTAGRTERRGFVGHRRGVDDRALGCSRNGFAIGLIIDEGGVEDDLLTRLKFDLGVVVPAQIGLAIIGIAMRSGDIETCPGGREIGALTRA